MYFLTRIIDPDRSEKRQEAHGLSFENFVLTLSSFADVCLQDLDAKMREKSALSKQMADLKRGKLQCPVHEI